MSCQNDLRKWALITCTLPDCMKCLLEEYKFCLSDFKDIPASLSTTKENTHSKLAISRPCIFRIMYCALKYLFSLSENYWVLYFCLGVALYLR